MTKHSGLLVLISALAWPGIAFASPNTTQPIDNTWKTCTAAVTQAERTNGIPKHLLNAISMAESGRWHPEKRANIAWPWTVTANGKGRFYDSKAEAVAEAEILMTQGLRNIDVGCMQINLGYHADAFETLSRAFDPAANAAYGAKYLRKMHDRTKDWRKATAFYHSTTPAQAARYRAKVMRLWDQARGVRPAPKAVAKAQTPAEEPIFAARARPANIDYALGDRLNAAFRKRRERSAGEELADRAANRAHQRRQQLDSWRRQQAQGVSLAHLANMRRAELAQRRNKKINQVSSTNRAAAFADRRRKDLAAWRAKRTDPHFVAYSN
jgi:hypothetical protein